MNQVYSQLDATQTELEQEKTRNKELTNQSYHFQEELEKAHEALYTTGQTLDDTSAEVCGRRCIGPCVVGIDHDLLEGDVSCIWCILCCYSWKRRAVRLPNLKKCWKQRRLTVRRCRKEVSSDVIASLESRVYMFTQHGVVVCKMCTHDCFQSHMAGVKHLYSPPIFAHKHTSFLSSC